MARVSIDDFIKLTKNKKPVRYYRSDVMDPITIDCEPDRMKVTGGEYGTIRLWNDTTSVKINAVKCLSRSKANEYNIIGAGLFNDEEVDLGTITFVI